MWSHRFSPAENTTQWFYITEWEEQTLVLVNSFVNKLTDRFTSKLAAITEALKNIKSQNGNIIYPRSTWKMPDG